MIKLLKPYKTKYEKVRLGSLKDGGYVVPSIILESCSAIFSYGVGGDISYELDFISKYNKPAYLFDHTIGLNNYEKELEIFTSEGLGNDGSILFTPKQHYDRFGVKEKIYLKIDVEGAEYAYFLGEDILELQSFVCGIVVEFHWIEDSRNRDKLYAIIEKLSKHYSLCHIHGNNWGGIFDLEQHTIPRVLELSFISNEFMREYQFDSEDYPIAGLDYPNNPDMPECDLSFLKLI